ncbi:MAG: Flp pilus assembly protein CpaB [Syntrophaceticus sp.]
MRPKLMIVFAVIFAFLAAGSCYVYLQGAVEEADKIEKAQVVQAAADIKKDTRITEDMVELVELPVDSIHSGALRSLDDVVGRIALERIIVGEQVLEERVVKEGEAKAGLAYQIPEGKRAFTVAVDEVAAVGWHLLPKDHVDILGIVESDGSIYSYVVLQDVPVLAVGKEVQEANVEGAEGTKEVKTVTLAVALQEARSLMLASEQGRIQFALRSPVDHQKQKIVPLGNDDLLKAGS